MLRAPARSWCDNYAAQGEVNDCDKLMGHLMKYLDEKPYVTQQLMPVKSVGRQSAHIAEPHVVETLLTADPRSGLPSRGLAPLTKAEKHGATCVTAMTSAALNHRLKETMIRSAGLCSLALTSPIGRACNPVALPEEKLSAPSTLCT